MSNNDGYIGAPLVTDAALVAPDVNNLSPLI